jgi:type I restriction-modification system DNA methylase subunit
MTIVELMTALRGDGMTTLTIAEALNVSPDTVERWRDGRTKPRPQLEGRLRRLAAKRGVGAEVIRLDIAEISTKGSEAAEEKLDSALRKLREALHRHGRLSSRNEALDEVAKLIFAHVASLRAGGKGIGSHLLTTEERGAAANLRTFVAEMCPHLPKSLSYEMTVRDFNLQLKEGEDDLARDIVQAFQHLKSGIETESRPLSEAGDLINHAFGRFLADSFSDEKELGQYLTPTEVVQFMVKLALADLSQTERDSIVSPDSFDDFGLVMDPSCGVGSFLAEFIRAAHAEFGLASNAAWTERATSDLLVGIDKSERMIRLALANLATFGSPAANLHLANGLLRRGQDGQMLSAIEGKVGLILTNPPFGASFEDADLTQYRLATEWSSRRPVTIDSELLFMERYLDWLRPGGQLLAIVPDSILTNKGLFADLRRGLAPNVQIRTVISLPPVTFAAAGTSTKTSILHLRKGDDSTRYARFAICNDIGYSVSTRGAQRKKVRDSESELPGILSELTSGQLSLVQENGETAQADRWDASYHASLPADFVNRLAHEQGWVRVGEVAELVADRADPRRGVSETFEYIEISDVDSLNLIVTSKETLSINAPSRARRSVKAGDVLVSTVRPDRRTIGVVPEWLDGAVCTTGFAVLRPKALHPLVLAALLRTEFVTRQLLRNNIGIAYPAIEPGCLIDILLPVSHKGIANCEESARLVESLRNKLKESTDQFVAAMARNVGKDEVTSYGRSHTSAMSENH